VKRLLTVEEAREGLRRWLVAATGCDIQHTGWPCGTCTIHLLTRLGLVEHHPAYHERNADPDRHNEVWRAILQIRDTEPQCAKRQSGYGRGTKHY
jgi:hypothetical protein